MIEFGVIGAKHVHVDAMIAGLRAAGGQLVAQSETLENADAILEDRSIRLVVIAAVPAERAAIGIAAMRHGKDVLAAKPAVLAKPALAELRQAHSETGRRFWVWYAERLDSPATTKALELVRAGRIGTVAHVLGFGPHRLDRARRPDWFFDNSLSGGILDDLASHQIDQFLMFANASEAIVEHSKVETDANGFQYYGHLSLAADRVHGYAKVDWLSPDGLSSWGDGRTIVTGCNGYLEVRRTIDLAGRPGGEHLFVVDDVTAEYVDCSALGTGFFDQLIVDIRDGSDLALPQRHCFAVTALAIEAQARAESYGMDRR